MTYYTGTHRSQFDGGPKANENCTPASGANGARAATGGRVDKSGSQVRALVKSSEETNPATPGWSLKDLDLAMSRLGVGFVIGTGGWVGLRQARKEGKIIVIQGDSEEFPNGTCSGVFDGDHAVAVHPDTNAAGEWLLADPICKTRRWERESVLRAYAENFWSGIGYGIFTSPVPQIAPPPPATTFDKVRVANGSWWDYAITGTVGAYTITRTSRGTAGFSAAIGTVIPPFSKPPMIWKGAPRRFARLLAPSAYAGRFVDLLDAGSVTLIPKE